MVKVARLYHEHGVRQPEIARRLHISQARVSRLLKQAELDGIVRTTVVVPEGVQTGARGGSSRRAYGLREAVVVECSTTRTRASRATSASPPRATSRRR